MAKNYKLNAAGLPIGEGLFWRKPFIHAKVYIDGQPVRFSTNETEWRKALEARDAEVERRATTTEATGLENITVDVLMQNYLRHLQVKNAARGEYEPQTAYIVEKCYSKHLKQIWGSKPAVKIGSKEIDAYRLKRLQTGDSPATVDHELGYIRSAFLRGDKNSPKLYNKHVLPDFKIDHANQTANHRTGTITMEQYKTLIAAMPEWVKPIFAYCIWTGVRKKEARFTKRSKVNYEDHTVVHVSTETKSKKERKTGVADIAWNVIMDWEQQTRLNFPHCVYLFHMGGERIESGALDTAFDAVCRQVGFSTPRKNSKGEIVRRKNRMPLYDHSVRWHDSRRTYVTLTGNTEGINDVDRGRTSGHTPEMTALYDNNESAIKVRDAINRKLGQGQTVTQPAAIAPASSKGDWKAELRDLKETFEMGLLPEDLYKAEVSKVMASR